MFNAKMIETGLL